MRNACTIIDLRLTKDLPTELMGFAVSRDIGVTAARLSLGCLESAVATINQLG